jgi:hypothetical protein
MTRFSASVGQHSLQGKCWVWDWWRGEACWHRVQIAFKVLSARTRQSVIPLIQRPSNHLFDLGEVFRNIRNQPFRRSHRVARFSIVKPFHRFEYPLRIPGIGRGLWNWWVWGLTRTFRNFQGASGVNSKMPRNLIISLAWSIGLLVIVNWIDFLRRPACFDCGFPRGVPFTLYFDPTFNSITGRGDILWSGVVENVGFALASSGAAS